MANTTNFGWETPDDTDLVKDGAAAIRTLGNSIDTSLVDFKGGTTGQVLSKNSNTDMDFTWIAVDPLTILDAKGDLISATAADTPARLAVGSNGQVLQADSTTSTGLKWATLSSGKLLQAVSTAKSDTFTVASSTYTDVTGLSVSITPTANTSKILVIASVNHTGGAGSNSSVIRLVRGSTAIAVGDAASNRTQASAEVYSNDSSKFYTSSIMYLDSPATTSATTYKIQQKNNGAGTAYLNRSETDGDSAGYNRGFSSITVLEIGA